MWNQWKRRLVFTQSFIFALTLVAFLFGGQQWGQTFILFLMMELGGLLGAWWGKRIRERIEAQAVRLPLQRR